MRAVNHCAPQRAQTRPGSSRQHRHRPLCHPSMPPFPPRSRAAARTVTCSSSPVSAHQPVVQPLPPVDGESTGLGFQGVHHVAVCCADLQRSLDFYCGLLGATCVALRAVVLKPAGCGHSRGCCFLWWCAETKSLTSPTRNTARARLATEPSTASGQATV